MTTNPTASGGTYEQFTFDTGSLPLTSGQQYIAFVIRGCPEFFRAIRFDPDIAFGRSMSRAGE